MSAIEVSSLCKHAFINEIRDKIPSEQTKCMDFIAYGQDILYIWNSFDVCVHSVNIKHSIRDSDLSTQLILQPRQGILFSPDRIFLNVSSTLLALSASSDDNSGIAVLELPERWSTVQKTLRVPCKNLGERLFLGEQLVLRQAKWHPGSPSDSHLLVLTSDECLRLFNASTGEVLWKCHLSQKVNRITHPSIPTKVTLGDTPVDFDIGPPPFEENPQKISWPILILWGNGDIYCVESTIEDSRERIPAHGPLRMFPSSDDNYGSDASSILVLQTSPPIVAFSTSIGTIYNCIYLTSEEQQNGYDKALYVVECIELELGISLGEDDDIVSCPIKLIRNPIEKSVYFSIHKAGIHSITLPLVTKLYEFLESSEPDFSPYSSESLVEYLLCTGVNRGSSLETLPLLGCAFIDLSSSILVLLNNQDMINIRITPHILHSIQNLEANVNHDKDEEGFLMHIQNILKEHGPGPVIRLPESDPQDIFNIIYKIKLSYKRTMDAHEMVGKKLETKTNSLMAALMEQEREIQRLSHEQENLYASARKIGERYSEINERQMSLMYRIENVLRNVCLDSKLTEKERNAMDYLESIQKRINIFEDEIRKIRTASKHQESMVEERVETMTRRGIDLGDMRGRTMRKQLHNLTSEISLLMKRVKTLEETVPEIMFRSTMSSIRNS